MKRKPKSHVELQKKHREWMSVENSQLSSESRHSLCKNGLSTCFTIITMPWPWPRLSWEFVSFAKTCLHTKQKRQRWRKSIGNETPISASAVYTVRLLLQLLFSPSFTSLFLIWLFSARVVLRTRRRLCVSNERDVAVVNVFKCVLRE